MSHHLRDVAISAALSAGVMCGLVQGSAAQSAPVLTKGIRVRVVTPPADPEPDQVVTGSLVRLENDTAEIWTGGTIAAPEIKIIALDSGRRLELPSGVHGHGGTGAAVGALFGAVVGAVIGSANERACKGYGGCIQGASAGAFVGAAGGAVLGLVIGSAIRSESWVPVYTVGARIAIQAGVGGIRITF